MDKPEFENVSLDIDTSIRLLQYSCSSFQNNHTWHFHPQYEIAYVLKGCGQRFVGDHISAFYPGDLVFIGPNIPHCWISEDSNMESEMLVLQFTPDFLGKPFYAIPEATYIKALFDNPEEAFFFPNPKQQAIKAQLEKMPQYRGIELIAHLLILFDKLAQSEKEPLVSQDYTIKKDTKGGRRLTKAIDYVKNHLHCEIKQPEVAELVSMTPQSFSRFFRTQTGRTFVSFVNEVRITQACHLLSTSDQDVLDIAYDCGYTNISHFNRMFMENRAMTPSAYRDSQRLKFGNEPDNE